MTKVNDEYDIFKKNLALLNIFEAEKLRETIKKSEGKNDGKRKNFTGELDKRLREK